MISASHKLLSLPNSASSSTAPSALPSAKVSPTTLEPPAIPSPITPLSITDDEGDDRDSYFTASERDSVGPATPSRTSKESRARGSTEVLSNGHVKISEEGVPVISPIKEGTSEGLGSEISGSAAVRSEGDSPTKGGSNGLGMPGLGGLKGMMGRLGL